MTPAAGCPAGRTTPAGPGRRGVLTTAVVAGLGLGGCSLTAGSPSGTAESADLVASGATTAGAAPAEAVQPFRAARQPGIRGRVQPFAAFVAFDLTPGSSAPDVRRILRIWSDDIEHLMTGRPPLTDPEPELARHTAGLTVTVGVGPRIVELVRGADAVPAWLGPLPAYPQIDKLEDRWSGGDLLLQICADSPTTLAHAQRRLTLGVRSMAETRWVQRGFREPLDTGEHLIGMRNLFGQVDGTIQPADDEPVFIGAGGPDWLRDGSSIVIRRIRMDLDKWEQVDRLGRENAMGRRLTDGAPLTGGAENDIPDVDAKDALGFPVIDPGAHVRRARATTNTERFLRRPYSYDDGTGEQVDAGLIFVAYCADPLAQFDPVQKRLAAKDLMNIWTTPIGSAVFAILPGPGDGESLGQALLA